jgi:ketosteroid isomerase-like protein
MKYLVIALLLLAVFGCGPRKLSREREDQIKIQIYALMDSITAGAEKMDLSVEEKYLSDDKSAIFYIGGKAKTKQELLDEFQKLYDPIASQKMEVTRQSVTVFNEDAALYKAQISTVTTFKDGRAGALALCETWLWEKQNEQWKVTHYHESWQDATPPAAEEQGKAPEKD